MVAFSYNDANVGQNLINQITQDQISSCGASCGQEASGNVIIINGGNVGGFVGVQQTCSANANCLINNLIETNVQNVVDSLIQQENKTVTDILGDLSFNASVNSVNIAQNIRNYVTQITESTCNASVTQVANDNLIYVTGGAKINDFVGFQLGNSGTSANASCTMNNTSKVVIYNQEQANATQSNTTIGMFAIIIIAIVVLLLIGAIIFVILASTGVIGKFFGKKSEAANNSLTPEELALLSAASSTPTA